MNKNVIIIIVLLVLVGVGAFFAGIKYQESKRNTNFAQGRQGSLRQGISQNFRPIRGEILSIDDKSLTVKLQDGSSKIVILSTNTNYLKTDKTSKTDLKSGITVVVLGSQNSDGSVTAQDIQINSQIRGEVGTR